MSAAPFRPWVTTNGAAPGLQDLVAGGVEIVPCSLPEARSLIDAGKVKSLAVMNDTPAALYPNVPTLKAATCSDWKIGAWRGSRLLAVRDAGFTEVEPGPVTVVAQAPRV